MLFYVSAIFLSRGYSSYSSYCLFSGITKYLWLLLRSFVTKQNEEIAHLANNQSIGSARWRRKRGEYPPECRPCRYINTLSVNRNMLNKNAFFFWKKAVKLPQC